MLYCGYGDYALDEEIKSKLRFPLFESKIEKLNFERESIEKPSLEDWERKMIKKSVQGTNPLVKLNEEAFTEYFIDLKNKDMFDFDVFVGKHKFPINRIKIMAKSEYFTSLFSMANLS